MRIGEVAAAANVTVETLRYYERRGLLETPPRQPSGYRTYPPEAVGVVRFIKDAQDLGFALDDIAEMLHLARGGPDNCDTVRHLANTKIAVFTEKITRLEAMRDALTSLTATCELPRSHRDCPLLATIATGSAAT